MTFIPARRTENIFCEEAPGAHQQVLCCAGCSQRSMVAFPQNGIKVFAMRHRKKVAKLGRPADQRKALVRTLTTEVLRHGRITTTKVQNLSLSAVYKIGGHMITLKPTTAARDIVQHCIECRLFPA